MLRADIMLLHPRGGTVRIPAASAGRPRERAGVLRPRLAHLGVVGDATLQARVTHGPAQAFRQHAAVVSHAGLPSQGHPFDVARCTLPPPLCSHLRSHPSRNPLAKRTSLCSAGVRTRAGRDHSHARPRSGSGRTCSTRRLGKPCGGARGAAFGPSDVPSRTPRATTAARSGAVGKRQNFQPGSLPTSSSVRLSSSSLLRAGSLKEATEEVGGRGTTSIAEVRMTSRLNGDGGPPPSPRVAPALLRALPAACGA